MPKTREQYEAIEDNKAAFLVMPVYLLSTAIVGVIYLILHHFWGNIMVLDIGELLRKEFHIQNLHDVWLMFVWAIASTLLICLLSGRTASRLSRFEQIVRGIWVSINAGVFEEIIFRVFMFLNAMVILTFFNFITFGFVEWLYTAILSPVANFFTFYALDDQLQGGGWLLGAAIISANVRFRNGHKHQGLLGMINSWFMGMVLFWLMFHYGIVAAITAHVLYDVLVFTTDAVLSVRKSSLEILLE